MKRRDFAFVAVFPHTLVLAAPGPTVLASFRRQGIAFTIPESWKVEDSEDAGAIYAHKLNAPDSVEASLLVELPRAFPERPLADVLAERSESLAGTRVVYEERRRLVVRHRALSYGLLEYRTSREWFSSERSQPRQ